MDQQKSRLDFQFNLSQIFNLSQYWCYTYTRILRSSAIPKHPWKQLHKSESTGGGRRWYRWNHRILGLTSCSYYIQVKDSWVPFYPRILYNNFLEYISLSIFTDLRALGAKLGRDTTSIRITWGIIKTKTSSSFLEGFWVIKGQSHWDPHQDYCRCNALVNIINKTKKSRMKFNEQIL